MTDPVEKGRVWLDGKVSDAAARAELTEDALALAFCEAHPLLRYVARWNRWMMWDACRWLEDDTLSVYDRVRHHVRRIVGDRDDKDATAVTKAQTIAAIERLAKADRRYAATVDQWDADPWMLNTPGGIVDLRDGTLGTNDPQAYLTKSASAGPAGGCPTWLAFLKDVTAGDEDYIRFLQRVVGYAATGSIAEHAMFFLYGPGGNGKGTFLNTLKRVLGDYATVASMEVFTESNTDRHPTELAMLRGARLVLAQETEEGRAWAEARIKALTGGDPVTARFMRQDFFTFEPTFKLIVAGNHKPKLRNVDDAIKRRFHLLPFMQKFSGERVDKHLADRLMDEAGGIIRWIVEGALAYQNEGLSPPKVVQDATAEYFAAQNLFDQWLQDCCETGPNHWEPSSRLFQSWRRYAEAAHERVGDQKTLGERLEAAGFLPGNTRPKGGRHWNGLRLIPEEIPDDWRS
jgi:putative DNA primase/helicase